MTTLTTADHWITTDRGRLFARSWSPVEESPSTRPTVVLLHDSLGCVELWRDFPAKLAEALRLPVVAYDRLGFGRSDAYPGAQLRDFIRAETAAGLLPVCEQLGLERLIPFGHSVGGGMAVAAAAELPERCVAVITESAQAFVEDRTRNGIREAAAAFEDPAQFSRLERYHGLKARWVLDAWTETWLSPEFADWTLDEDLSRVRCPLFALHGDRDEYGTERHPERIAVLAGGESRFVLLPGCGHVPHRERGDVVIRDVAEFLGTLG
jgi:pimeloyl-ACP methyl ester carboxylesterase